MRRILIPLVLAAAFVLPGCRSTSDLDGDVPGGYSTAAVKSKDIRAAAEFAVAEQSRLASRPVQLLEVLSAQQQVVSGMNYRLVLRVKDDGKTREAVVMVWWQAWNAQTPYRLTSWDWR